MTQDEIIKGRERLAKWMGWKQSISIPEIYWTHETNCENIKVSDWLPDQDLYQIHEIEKKLTDGQWETYGDLLYDAVLGTGEQSKHLRGGRRKRIIHATALQKFEALIKAIGE